MHISFLLLHTMFFIFSCGLFLGDEHSSCRPYLVSLNTISVVLFVIMSLPHSPLPPSSYRIAYTYSIICSTHPPGASLYHSPSPYPPSHAFVAFSSIFMSRVAISFRTTSSCHRRFVEPIYLATSILLWFSENLFLCDVRELKTNELESETRDDERGKSDIVLDLWMSDVNLGALMVVGWR